MEPDARLTLQFCMQPGTLFRAGVVIDSAVPDVVATDSTLAVPLFFDWSRS